MASKFGGIPVSSDKSKYGGVPVNEPVDSVTEVESTYSGPSSWIDRLLQAAGGGAARALPGASMLSEKEPRVIFEEKKNFVPLVGRIPVVGRYLAPEGPQTRPALVWAPPGTEERSRAMYPGANIMTAGTPEESAALEREISEGERKAAMMPAAATVAEILANIAKSSVAGAAAPASLPAAAQGAIAAAPSAIEPLSTGHPAAAGAVLGAGAMAGELGKRIQDAAYKSAAAKIFESPRGLPKEVGEIVVKVSRGGKLSKADKAVMKEFGLVLRRGNVWGKAQPTSSWQEWNDLLEGRGLTPTTAMRWLEKMGKLAGEEAKLSAPGAVAGSAAGAISAPKGKRLQRAALGALLGAAGRTPFRGAAGGMLPWLLMDVMRKNKEAENE